MPKRPTRTYFVAVLALLFGGIVAHPSAQNLLFWVLVKQATLTASTVKTYQFGKSVAL